MNRRIPSPDDHWPAGRTIRVCRFLLRAASRSMPVLCRPDWLAEWESELWILHRNGSSRAKLLRYALSAFGEARWEKRTAEGTMGGIGQDFRYVVRRLSRNPAFAAVTVLVLALGIGANTALYSALKAALLDVPPYPEADRIVTVDLVLESGSGAVADTMPWSWPKFALVRERLQSVELVAGFAAQTNTITGDGAAARIGVEYVTPAYFELLGVTPLVGRLFGDEADVPNPGTEAILSHGFWQSRYGGDRSIVGRILTLEGKSLEIVGVAPDGFRGVSGSADIWVPVAGLAAIRGPRRLQLAHAHWLVGLARLEPGVTLEQARSVGAAFGRALGESYPDPSGDTQHVTMVPFLDARVNPVARLAVSAASAGGILLLLIACGNVGGLLLARQSARRTDVAVRSAMGAGRARLLREFLLESLLLSSLGGALGLALAWVGRRTVGLAAAAALDTTGTRGLQFLDPTALSIDTGVLMAGVAMAMLTGLLFGALPAVAATRADITRDLRGGGRAVGRHESEYGRSILVTAQLALTLVLLTGAGLMAASFARLSAVDVGFTNDSVLSMSWSRGPGPSPDSDIAFETLLMDRLAALPGVNGVAIAPCSPLAGRCEVVGLKHVDDRVIPNAESGFPLVAYAVSDDYFRTLGIPVEAGRTFRPADGSDNAPVVVINATAARELFPGTSPIGHRMAVTHELTEDRSAEIVGVVADVPYASLEEGAMPAVYFSRTQAPSSYGTLFVSVTDGPMSLVEGVRTAVSQLDPELPLYDITTLAARRAQATARTRVVLWLFAAFAATALLLSAIGLYGLVTWTVVRRTREMGLRLALGATAPDVVRHIMTPATALAGAGIMAGILASWGLTRFVRGLLFGVQPSDPRVLIGAAVVLLAVVALAAWAPAARATRVDPAIALRAD